MTIGDMWRLRGRIMRAGFVTRKTQTNDGRDVTHVYFTRMQYNPDTDTNQATDEYLGKLMTFRRFGKPVFYARNTAGREQFDREKELRRVVEQFPRSIYRYEF